MRTHQLSKYIDRLTGLTILILLIPVFYLIFTPYTYGYGFNFLGPFLYFSPLLIIFMLKVRAGMSHTRNELKKNMNPSQKFPVLLFVLACFGLAAYTFGVVIQRLEGVSLFDIRSLYRHFSSSGDAERLTIIGLIGVLFVPLSFVLFAMRENFFGLKKYLLVIPVIVFVILNLLMAKRQISLFFIFFLLGIFIFRAPKINLKFFLRGAIVAFLFLTVVIYVGFQRSGFDSFDTQLKQNQHEQSVFVAPIFGLMWGYLGSGPEFLSVLTDNVDPLYLPFSTTNSFILRRINSIIDYVDYERDVTTKTTDVVENVTGLFARSWAGGVLQLYIEGGLFLIVAWYLTLFIWFKYILYRFGKGFPVLLDVSFFNAIFVMNLFVFPFKDQNVFLAFFWYLLVVATRHVRCGRLKIRLGI